MADPALPPPTGAPPSDAAPPGERDDCAAPVAPVPSVTPVTPAAPDELADLAARGADRHDPAGFRFLEALARRRETYHGTARERLDARLAGALADFAARFAPVGCAVTATTSTTGAPDAAVPAPAVAAPRPQGESPPTPLAELLRELSSRAAPAPGSTEPAEAPPLPELKSLDYFRDSWSQLSIDQQFAQAMAQVPDNAGPLNSHLLILRALQRMHEISPDYLSRFIAYADTLVWLDQATGGSLPSSRTVVWESKAPGDTTGGTERKPPRPRKRPPAP